VTHEPRRALSLHICADSLAFQGRITGLMPAARSNQLIVLLIVACAMFMQNLAERVEALLSGNR
jgi:hypothetical protein